MPTAKNPFVYGNLFLLLSVEFPDALTTGSQDAIRTLLPAPLHERTWTEGEEFEVHSLTDIDPVESRSSNRVNMAPGSEAYDRDDEDRPDRMPGGCQQQ